MRVPVRPCQSGEVGRKLGALLDFLPGIAALHIRQCALQTRGSGVGVPV